MWCSVLDCYMIPDSGSWAAARARYRRRPRWRQRAPQRQMRRRKKRRTRRAPREERFLRAHLGAGCFLEWKGVPFRSTLEDDEPPPGWEKDMDNRASSPQSLVSPLGAIWSHLEAACCVHGVLPRPESNERLCGSLRRVASEQHTTVVSAGSRLSWQLQFQD